MLNTHATTAATTTPAASPVAEVLGHVQSVSGSQATIGLLNAAMSGPNRAVITVGRFLKIQTAKSQLVGVITEVSIQSSLAHDYCAVARIDLMGEFVTSAAALGFRRGVSGYPTIRDTALPLSNKELRVIFDEAGSSTIGIGSLQQDTTVNARVDVDEMLNKHFAVLGSTGVGKSTGVAHILNQTMKLRPKLRIFLLDAHNEYQRSFGPKADIMNPGNLRLPFWLFNFEEIVDVFFAGRPGLQEEADILAELIPTAKSNYSQYRGNNSSERPAIKRPDAKNIGYTVDTPVPYRLADLLALIDDRMGKLENRSSRMIYQRLITRIETVSNDPRYAFMFERANVGGDTMAEAISQLFRLQQNDSKTMTIMQLAGFPAEVVEPVVSVLTRLAFDFGLWSDGAVPLLFVCEEAHKYASADHNAGFAPTRRALARIAKEGRKHGVYLGLVTQRPAELDPTIISQCGTLFAMRMSNDRDQALLRSAVADHGANLFAFVPSLGTREAIAFGAGVPLPTRLTFPEMPSGSIPKSESFVNKHDANLEVGELDFITAVVDRWRRATMNQQQSSDEPMRTSQQTILSDAAPLQPAATTAPIDANRLSLLKKPIGAV